MAKINYWMPREKAALNKPAAHILHDVLAGAKYEEVTEAL
jgi:hypothetical protein